MYAAWDAHYRQVTVLRFTQDGGALLSGSEDSGVNVWAVSKYVCILFSIEHYVLILVQTGGRRTGE